MFIRIKTVRKNGKEYKYKYLQHNYRVGKKVKSKMTYLGAVETGIAMGAICRA